MKCFEQKEEFVWLKNSIKILQTAVDNMPNSYGEKIDYLNKLEIILEQMKEQYEEI